MPVGFPTSPPLVGEQDPPTPLAPLENTDFDPNYDTPQAPWVLQFCAFLPGGGGPDGAHAFSLSNGQAGLGAGITVAHPDTGYTLHPELTHEDLDPTTSPVRIDDARSFCAPYPSMQSLPFDVHNSTSGAPPQVLCSRRKPSRFRTSPQTERLCRSTHLTRLKP